VRLWRLVRPGHEALDGAGALRHGARYTPPGVAVVPLASEAGLAVLVALRYHAPDDRDDYRLGWVEVDASPEHVPADDDEPAVRKHVTAWLDEQRSLLLAVRSRVLPEAHVVLLNPAHPAAARLDALTTRPFRFADCLHEPPMLASFRSMP
jgi:RES domain-containing protein